MHALALFGFIFALGFREREKKYKNTIQLEADSVRGLTVGLQFPLCALSGRALQMGLFSLCLARSFLSTLHSPLSTLHSPL